MSSSLDPKARFCRTDRVAHRRIEDEVLIIPIRTAPDQKLGIISLNATASLLWELLERPHSIAELTQALCDRFQVRPETATADVQACCQHLLGCDAIEPIPGGS